MHNRAKVPPQPLIARLLATWGTLKRVPHSSTIVHSSTIDLFVCEFRNYELLLNILWCFKRPSDFPIHCFKSFKISLPFFSLSFSTFMFVWWEFYLNWA